MNKTLTVIIALSIILSLALIVVAPDLQPIVAERMTKVADVAKGLIHANVQDRNVQEIESVFEGKKAYRIVDDNGEDWYVFEND